MSTIVLRSVVNRALTSTEIDANFDNLNTGKVETTAPIFSGTVTLPSQSIALTDSNLPDVAPTLNLDFANSKQLDSRITFGRGSGGAYYDGKTTAKAEENLLFYSQTIGGSGWASISITPAINTAIAPDNSLTATTLTATAGSGVPRTVSNLTGTAGIIYTVSVYAKAGTFNIFQIYDGSGSDNRWANFDLTAGTAGTPGTYGNCTPSITAVGNGWYRCIVTYTPVSTSIQSTFVMAATTSSGRAGGLLAVGTESWYLWGAQLEQRSSATAYTPTTTAPITNYIPVLLQAPLNTPRFDHDSRPTFNGTCTVSGSAVTLPTTFADGSSPSTINKFYTGSITISETAYVITNYVGSTRVVTVTGGTPTAGAFSLVNKNYGQSLGLLIEEARENKLKYSSDFSNAIWALSATSIVNATTISPDGTQNAGLLIASTATGNHFAYNGTFPTASATSYTFSIYVKKAGYSTCLLNLYDQGGGASVGSAFFNVSTGLVLSSTASSTSITPVGNDWYRCTITGPALSGALIPYIYLTNGTNYPSTGNGYSGIYIWGAQLEAGSFATSYIPTPSNATVTRQPDLASMTGTNFSSWYNQSEGTLYDEVDFYSGSNEHSFALIGPSYTNFGITNIKTDSTHRAYDVYTNPNVYVGRQSFNYSPSQKYKEVVAYTNTYYISSMDGVISSPTYGNITANNATRLLLGQYFFSLTMCGHIRKLTYYPKALSAPQLQGLTK